MEPCEKTVFSLGNLFNRDKLCSCLKKIFTFTSHDEKIINYKNDIQRKQKLSFYFAKALKTKIKSLLVVVLTIWARAASDFKLHSLYGRAAVIIAYTNA